MKREISLMFLFLTSMFFVSLASAAGSTCSLSTALVNQDPVHAVPGEYVKLVFQVNGVDNPACGNVNFAINPEYPFSLDPGVSASKMITSGTFTSTYNSQATIPYTVRVDKDALDSEYNLKVNYGSDTQGASAVLEKTFSISVKDVRTDFDVFVSDYAAATNTITFGILNTGKDNAEALTVDIPKQDSIDVKGSNKAIVGTLDANQDTTFTYEAKPTAGDIKVVIKYNDANGERREVTKVVNYDSSYFTGRVRDVKTTSKWNYVGYVVAALVLIWLVRKIFFKKKKIVHN